MLDLKGKKIGLQEIEAMKIGYQEMGILNVNLSEEGFDRDRKDLENYEKYLVESE